MTQPTALDTRQLTHLAEPDKGWLPGSFRFCLDVGFVDPGLGDGPASMGADLQQEQLVISSSGPAEYGGRL